MITQGQESGDRIMPYVVKLIHPNAEREVTEENIECEGKMKWAVNKQCEGHRRKFLSCEGQYMTSLDSNPINDKVMFWGEWEPPSSFKRIIYPNMGIADDLPCYVHTPQISHVPEVEPVLNTDPYVLGKAFYYSCCQQKRLLARHDLPENTVILFGSRLHHRFVLDTVFVVDNVIEDSSTLTPTAYEAIIAAYPNRPPERRLFQGKMRSKTQKTMFSYFPCLPFIEGHGFKRPIISFGDEDLSHFGIRWSDNQGQGFSCTLLNDEMVIALWQAIVQKVLENGLYLGIYAQEPELPNQVQ